MNEQRSATFDFGPFRLDAGQHLLFRNGERVPLPPKAIDLLVVLVAHRGRVVAKEDLLAQVWPKVVVEENALARTVSLLRRTLGTSSHDESLIETIPKRGYRFMPAAVAAADPVSESAPPAGRAAPAGRRRIQAFVIGGIAAVTIGAAALWWSSDRRDAAGAAPIAQLAVLPFRVSQNDPALEYLGIAIPDAITTRLANIRALRVRPSASALRIGASELDPQRAGDALRVDHVLTGTLYPAGENIRANLQLINVADGVPVWGNTVQFSAADLTHLQDHPVVDALADALRVRVTDLERERVFRRLTNDPAAYAAYVRGRANLVQHTERATRDALAEFTDAVGRDPSFAAAHAGIATAAAEMGLRFAPADAIPGWSERAVAAAREAIRLDETSAEAHEAMAVIHRKADFQWDATLKHSLRALELNPNLDMPYYYMAGAYYHLGLMDIGESAARYGMQVNPGGDMVEAKRSLATNLLLAARYKEARALMEEVRRLSDGRVSDYYLALSRYYDGDVAGAEKLLDEQSASSSASSSSRARALKAALLAKAGRAGEAREMARSVAGIEDADGFARGTRSLYMDHHVAYSLATAWAQLGEPERTLGWLKLAADTGFPCYPWFAADPLLAPAREHPAVRRYLHEGEAVSKRAREHAALPPGLP